MYTIIRVVSFIGSQCFQHTFHPSNNTTTYSGLCADILNLITERHNLTVEINMMPTFDWGVLRDDGNWSGT